MFYKNIEFETELHARWAVFFDVLGIEWEYRSCSYDLGELGEYTPEFDIKLNDDGRGVPDSLNWFVRVNDTAFYNDDETLKAEKLDSKSLDFDRWGCRVFGRLKFVVRDKYCDTCVEAQLLNVSVSEYNRAIRVATRKKLFSHKRYVYRFVDRYNNIIYVGRTIDIKTRMKQHFSTKGHLPKECYESVHRIEYITTKTSNDMKIKELYYIGKWLPRFNKADKNETSVSIDETNDTWSVYTQSEG